MARSKKYTAYSIEAGRRRKPKVVTLQGDAHHSLKAASERLNVPIGYLADLIISRACERMADKLLA